MIPRVSYADIQGGLPAEVSESIKRTGTVIVTGGIPKAVSSVRSECCGLR